MSHENNTSFDLQTKRSIRVPKKDNSKRDFECCETNNSNSIESQPISLNININNSVVTTTNATIVSPAQATLTKKLQNGLTAQIQHGLNKRIQHSYQLSEVTPKEAQKKASMLNSKRESQLEHTLATSSHRQGSLVSQRIHNSEKNSEPETRLDTRNISTLPLSPPQTLKLYRDKLTDYEKGEILDYQEIYFIGNTSNKQKPTRSSVDLNFGFDDERGYYNVLVNDHIAYRYEVIQYIGKGSFGQALKCFDHKEKQIVALKLLRSKKKLYHQGTVEVKILKFIRERDPEQKSSIVKMLDYFVFRKHIVLHLLTLIIM